jgi:hypothetical protein
MPLLKRYPNPYLYPPYAPNYAYPVYPAYQAYSYPYGFWGYGISRDILGTQFGSCDCPVGGPALGGGYEITNNCTNGAIPICVPGQNCMCYNPYLQQGGCFNEPNRPCTYR